MDGTADGRSEGNQRGDIDGNKIGFDIGYRDGFNRCARHEDEQQFRLGLERGHEQGVQAGRADGSAKGVADGSANGQAEGLADGAARADQAALTPATQAGRSQGLQDANSSDAAAKGSADGTAAGTADAQAQAQQVDYPRGLQDGLTQTLASSPIAVEDQFSQVQTDPASTDPASDPRPVDPPSAFSQARAWLANSASTLVAEVFNAPVIVPAPDHRFWNPRRHYPYGDENMAYRAGYGDGYNRGYGSAYELTFRPSWERGNQMGERRGCDEAQALHPGDGYQRGFDQGRANGYRESYQPAYDQARSSAYQNAFAAASARAYSDNYGPAYNRYFDAARKQAYADQSNTLYQQAFDAAKSTGYSNAYPVAAQTQYTQGVQDEKAKLAQTPIVLTSATIAGVDADSGQAAVGQFLTLRLEFRNLGLTPVLGNQVQLELTASDDAPVVINTSLQTLSHDLQAQSHTVVTEALGLQATAAAAGSTVSVHLRVSVLGTVLAEQDLLVNVQAQTPSELR